MTYDAVREESAVVETKGETAVLTAQALVTATIYGRHGTWPLKTVTRYVHRDGSWKPLHSRPPPTETSDHSNHCARSSVRRYQPHRKEKP